MATTTAPEEELNKLHALVARTLAQEIQKKDYMMVGGEETEVPRDVPPALLAQAIKFLKDNSITTTAETDENLQDLEKVLSTKQKRGRLLSVVPHLAAGDTE